MPADNQRAEALRAAYISAKDRLPASFDLAAFEVAVSEWECHPVSVDGALVGAVLVNGPELHACITPAGFGRWLSRPLLRLVDACMARFGYAMTRAQTQAGRRFVERIGFRATRLSPDVFLKVSHGH